MPGTRKALFSAPLKNVLAAVALVSAPGAFAQTTSMAPELVIITHDSFAAKGGAGEWLVSEYEKRCSCHVRVVKAGAAGQILTRLQLNARRGPNADAWHLVVGIDQHQWPLVRPFTESWGSWRPKGYDRLISEIRGPEGWLPYDYGIYALMADTQALGKRVPRILRLADLGAARWKKKFILEDPRVSSPGTAFLLFTESVMGTATEPYWKSIHRHWRALAPSWDAGYGLFLKGEAPLVWSYTTSQAYHEAHAPRGKKLRYRAVLFEEGNPVQVEGAAILKGGADDLGGVALARGFLEFLLEPVTQREIARRNWMLPVVNGVDAGPEFARLPKPRRLWDEKGADERRTRELLSKWAGWVAR